jgi:hypothetical protein
MMADRLEPVELIYHPDSIRADGMRGWGLDVTVEEQETVVEDW